MKMEATSMGSAPINLRAEMGPAVTKCLKRLARRHPVRLAAERIVSGEKLRSEDFNLLVDTVRDAFGLFLREHVVAAWCLGETELSPAERPIATSALRDLLSGSDLKGLPLWIPCVLGIGLVGAALLLLALVAGLFVPGDGLLGLTLIGGFLVVGAILIAIPLLPIALASIVHKESVKAKLRLAALGALGNLADPFAVGLVAGLFADSDNAVAHAARATLPTILESVREEHYGLLPRDATPALCDALEFGDHIHAVRVLEALGRAADGRAAEPVQRLIELPYSWQRWSELRRAPGAVQAVVSAAERVLPVLLKRRSQENHASRLLRPVESPGAPEDILLRPAGAASAVPEEQLLRPSSAAKPIGQADD